MARLVEGARAISFDKNDVIIHEGNLDQRLYQIGIGSVRVEKGVFPTVTLLARLEPGQVFGEMSLIAGGSANATVVADQDNTTVYMFDADYLRAAVHQQPSVAADFYRYLAHLLADRFRNTTLTSNLDLPRDVYGEDMVDCNSENDDTKKAHKKEKGHVKEKRSLVGFMRGLNFQK